ncbi:MAG TPA: hypothetical protein VEK79_03560 [Thermoanaerobaculia bacterium]|nr:hypothetical protein [Thermoanaerobaculia bacterium]
MMHTNVDVRIANRERLSANLGDLVAPAEATLWREAADVLRERVYATENGEVRVRAGWSGRPAKLALEVIDERDEPDVRDVRSFVDLFLHDAFLILNLAVPGSFSGTFDDVRLDARIFELAWISASDTIGPLPLADVVKWYDALSIGTRQLASTNIERALFHLLHLARVEEDDTLSLIRLAQAMQALDMKLDAELFELRDAILHGTAPVAHPMYDDTLDRRVDELDYTDLIDRASAAVVTALQARVREG